LDEKGGWGRKNFKIFQRSHWSKKCEVVVINLFPFLSLLVQYCTVQYRFYTFIWDIILSSS
jgi:hypothetical protein